MGSKLKFEAFVILQNSLKFSIGEESCPETVAGDYIRVTHPHCVSVCQTHLKYLEATQVDIDDNQEEANYLVQPGQDWQNAHKAYADFLKENLNSEKVARVQTKLETLEAGLTNFGSPAEEISNLIKDGISVNDVRAEIRRIEETAQELADMKDATLSAGSGVVFDVE